MREKILAKLREKFAGLPSHLLGRIADQLAKTVTAEDQIEGKVNELDNLPISLTDYATMLQTEGDRRVTEAQAKWKKDNPGQSTSKTEEPEKDKTEGANPNDALVKQVAEMQKTLQAMQQGQTRQSLGAKLKEKLKEKKIPEVFINKYTIDKEDDLDTIATAVETDYTALKQELANQGFAATSQPGGGGSTQTTTPTAVDANIDAWASKGKPATTGTTKT